MTRYVVFGTGQIGRPLIERLMTGAMSDELLDAHRSGRVEVAIGRASDYFGPGATRSALGETVFGTAVHRWVVDDDKFRTTVGDRTTPLDEALAATLAWYSDAAHPDTRATAGH
jgi:hypothetical protein